VQVLIAMILFLRRSDWRQPLIEWAGASFLGFTPLVVWLPYAWEAAATRQGIGWIPSLAARSVPAELHGLAVVLWTGIRPGWSPPADIWSAALLIVHGPPVLILLLAVISWRRERRPCGRSAATPVDIQCYLAAWAIAPVFGALAFSLLVYSLWGVPRFLMAAAPAWLIGAAVLIAESPPRKLATLTGVVFLVANLLTLGFERTHSTRPPWREAAQATASLGTIRTEAESERPQLTAFALGPRTFAWEPWQHALRQIRPEVELVPMDWSARTILGPEESFAVLAYGPSNDQDAWANDFPNHEVRRLLSTVVHEEPLTALPAPDDPRHFQLWAVVPRLKPVAGFAAEQE
jgi:hypothetical protein